MLNLSGKQALVTGASGGIGQAIAKQLINCGAKVILTGTRENILQDVKLKLGDNANYITCNMKNADEVNNLIENCEEKFGAIDILVCNAGITKDNLILRMKDDEWDNVIDVNLSATFKLNRAAIKKMMRRKWGRIINISSVVGVSGNPGQANYCASKAGMIGMSKSMAQEVASRGITINCIAPGFIKTPMTEALNDKQFEVILNNIPMKAMGEPIDIANSAVFLASEEAKYITGQTIHVNGGMLMV